MMHDRHKEWIKGRGIDPVLAEKFGVTTTARNGGNWLTVPYRDGDQTINHKYRLTNEKRFMMDEGADLCLWNLDALRSKATEQGDPVIICEGELDALAMMTAGFDNVVSVPGGAPQKVADEPESQTRYAWAWRNRDELAKVKTFIIAADSDAAGNCLAADLRRLLGVARCRSVVYPDGCKDANDVLLQHGSDALVRMVQESKPYPVKGLYTFDDFPEKGEVDSYPIGIGAINEHIAIVPGTLTVVTGFANMGKSTLLNQIMANAIHRYFPVCIASFETEVKPILRDGLRRSMMKCSEKDLRDTDTSDADDILAKRCRIITQTVEEDEEMTIEAFLEFCEIAVVRDGVRMIVLDPWNEIEHRRRRDETETEYIGRALRAVKRFAREHDVAFWIIAHPTKPESGSTKAPGLYAISGSAHWANKADYGLVYHRPDPTANKAQIIINKVRMGLPGQKGVVDVMYDFRRSEFVGLE